MHEDLAATVHFALPDGWDAVPFEHGLIYAPTAEIEALGPYEPEFLRVSLSIGTVERDAHPDAVAERMNRRVRQGRPETFQAEIDGVAARGFRWTDGVCDILSWFADAPDGPLVEVCLARSFATPHPTDEPLDALGDRLLQSVRWRTA